MRGSSSGLPLLARRELGEVAVIITLPKQWHAG